MFFPPSDYIILKKIKSFTNNSTTCVAVMKIFCYNRDDKRWKMNIKNNRRSRESKERLTSTLQNMIAKVGHKGLTVKDLCNEAKINRTTFYTHYDDIEDVLYQICEEYTVKVYTVFANNSIEYKQRVRQALSILLEKADFFEYVINTVTALDLRVLEIVEKNVTHPSLEPTAKLSLIYRIAGIIGVLKLYFNELRNKNGVKLSLDEIVELIYNIKHPKNLL